MFLASPIEMIELLLHAICLSSVWGKDFLAADNPREAAPNSPLKTLHDL